MDESHRIWQSTGSGAQVARFVKPPVGAGSIAGLPVRKQVALGRSWLFLQPSNSQRSSCLPNQKYEDFYCVCDPYLRTLAKRRGDPSKTNVVPCSTCFIRT